jgi:hypothetical protein
MTSGHAASFDSGDFVVESTLDGEGGQKSKLIDGRWLHGPSVSVALDKLL